jgi:hypothetical protein
MAAYVYLSLSSVVVAFQVALALGAPWGAYAMGGSDPGQLPSGARAAVLVQAAVLVLLAFVVAARAGIALTRLAAPSKWLVWVAVAVLSLSLVGNTLSSSGGERMLWVPVLILMLASAVLVATGRVSGEVRAV